MPSERGHTYPLIQREEEGQDFREFPDGSLFGGECVHPHRQAGFQPPRSVSVENTLLDGFVDSGEGLGDLLLGLLRVRCGQRLPETAEAGTENAFIPAVDSGAFSGLIRSFER